MQPLDRAIDRAVYFLKLVFLFGLVAFPCGIVYILYHFIAKYW